ncbi:MAG: MTH938/NDUFAF3 family protein [Thermoproteota archaeon]|nr:hypothetical protein [Candidatus Brockarchaeota archaeon]MBO3802065.1 hypothetical protein [Candidatus Brockarchaeota archaeon]
MITEYQFGKIVANGKTFTKDLIIVSSLNKVIDDWWREEGHSLKLDDIELIINEDYDYLVIGTGYFGRMKVEEEVFQELESRGKKVIVKPTKDAVKEFNRLLKENQKVIGAFHITC